MELYVLRHGEAEPHDAGVADADRALTRRGKRDVRAVLKAVRGAIGDPQLILTSPLRRAVETAEIARAVFENCTLGTTNQLKPRSAADGIWKELGRHPGADRIVLVGHEPHLDRMVGFLLGAPIALDFKKGGLMRIDCADRSGSPNGVLKWLLTPKLAKGL